MYIVKLYLILEDTLMEYIKASKAAEKWGISARRVRVLCAEGKIDGVIRKGNLYMIPENAVKPMDGRKGRTGLLLDIEILAGCFNSCGFNFSCFINLIFQIRI